MAQQNYTNHSRFSPWFHYFQFSLLLVFLVGSLRYVYRCYQSGEGLYSAILLSLAGVVMISMALNYRMSALKAQDRAIRAEESLRYFAITGKMFDAKLNIHQIIALRFASNEELAELANAAVEKNLSSKQIKQAIKNWRVDNYRV